jgi:ubiquinone biosynthesis protein UbiJ
MATQSPFSFFDPFLDKVGSSLQPPAWVVDEVQHRMVFLLNHVLMQEPEAQARLLRQKGSVVLAQWRSFAIKLQATPAGLLDLAAPDARSDLTLTVTEASPFALVQAAVRGEKPAVSIEGDVQLAAEVNWLVDHVRWDLEEDLSRVVGDVPAHALGDAVRRMTTALRQFVGARTGDAGKGGA